MCPVSNPVDPVHGFAGECSSTKRRRNRRADQFCVHVIAEEHRTPVEVIEFKAPHKLSLQELVVGLHGMDLDQLRP